MIVLAPPAMYACRVTKLSLRALAPALSLLALACGGASPPVPGSPGSEHGKLSELSRVDGEVELCSHKVPASTCTKHHPELAAKFQSVGDWCKPHGVPESQCLECHPDLTFDPLPKLPPSADVSWLAEKGEDVPSLDAHAVKGKVTVFDFSADWCAACRKVDGHVLKRIADGDASLAFRRLNVVDWESALAKRYLGEVPTLPLVVVYGTDGKPSATLHGANLQALDKALADAKRK